MTGEQLQTVSPEFVRRLINFSADDDRLTGFADMQLEGTVAVYNMLARNRCAYLADEVGMGKTYIALGVMSLLRFINPHARIIVITPRENIQRKWVKELQNFIRVNWLVEGNAVKSLQGGPAWEPVVCDSLLKFARQALLDADRDFFLRMTSFSLALKEEESRQRYAKGLKKILPWLDRRALTARTPEAFRDAFGCALNAAVPEADLLIVDEGHNLKHGFGPSVSNRNRIMGMAFGHPEGKALGLDWFKHRAKRVLLLSATPFEEDYRAIQRQFEVFGFGDVKLRDAQNNDPLHLRNLANPTIDLDEKRRIVSRIMVRRVSAMRIAGMDYTKNMYRREWRNGGYQTHDEPMALDDPKQQLIVALMQKKVAEVLQDERFNNHFQVGMLSSFESFLQSVKTVKKRKDRIEHATEEEEEAASGTFDGHEQQKKASTAERQGIDTEAITQVVDSYRELFGVSLPHPKLDATANSLKGAFDTGEKTLVFVRRVATVDELAAKLDRYFDRWLRKRMEDALPHLLDEIDTIFKRYDRERSRRPDEDAADRLDSEENSASDPHEEVRYQAEQDEGGNDTFFSWFFRGFGPSGYLSGAAFQKNRLASIAAIDATLFEDDHVAWLLGRPDDVLSALASATKTKNTLLDQTLRQRAYSYFRGRSQRKEGYPRLYVYEAYQVAALETLAKAGGELVEKASILLEERFPGGHTSEEPAPPGFPGPEDGLGVTTFFTELVKSPKLRQELWPDEPAETFRQRFRRRVQRAELLSAMARLGDSYIDLYLLAMSNRSSFALGRQREDQGESSLASQFVDLLEKQSHNGSGHAFVELSKAAETFDLILAVNFPQIHDSPLPAAAGIFGATLQRQVPVGRMSGKVNKRLVRQFRMPGFPHVLVATDVLQEGEDLHTFCHRVIHYGIAWTASAMEQRTGRVDRIGSLVQRYLDGTEELPPPEKFIQVYYPYLQETMELLQVRRVLMRLYRFLKLIHKTRRDDNDIDSRIDAASAMVEELGDIPQITGPLEPAFPVQEEWLIGELREEDVHLPDHTSREEHLDRLWAQLLGQYQIEDRSFSDKHRSKNGVAELTGWKLIQSSQPSSNTFMTQPFNLEMKSEVSGDATLLKCSSLVGELDLNDRDTFNTLFSLQRDHARIKICTRPIERKQKEVVTIEGDILFDPQTTQPEELVAEIRRTVEAAALFNQVVFNGGDSDLALGPAEVGRGSSRDTDLLAAQIDAFIRREKRQEKLRWEHKGNTVDVALWYRGRRQKVKYERRGAVYIFSSVVAGARHVGNNSRWRDLVRRTWRKNALKDLVTFTFDRRNRLVGVFEQPVDTLDPEEIRFYIETLAKECDRFEYILTGEDRE